MKYAALSGALFLLSYVAVNGGLGTQPGKVIVALIVAMAVALLVGWALRSARRSRSGSGPGPATRPGAPLPRTGAKRLF